MRYKISLVLLSIILSASILSARAEEELAWMTCVKEAKRDHPDLVAAKENLNQAKTSKEITRSKVMPQITLNASEVTAKNASSGNFNQASGSGSGGQQTTYEYGMTGQQLLFDGFKSSFDLSQAQRNINSAQYNYDVTSSNIRLRLRTAFVNLLTAQEFVKVTEEIEARRKQTLELVKLRYEGGREHKGSLMRSEADMAQATYQVNQAKRSIYLYQRSLTKELGRTIFIPMVAEGTLKVKEPVRERPSFEVIATTTPLLQQLIAQKEAAKFGLKSANAALFPQIFVNGGMDNTNTVWPPDKNEWSVGTSLTWPIFDGGNKFATITKTKAALKQAEANERSGRDGVIFTLSNTWTQLQDAVDNVDVQQKSLDASAERAKIAEAEYSTGLMTYDNWIIIEDDYVNAKLSYLTAQMAALTAKASWIQAKGGTLDYDKD